MPGRVFEFLGPVLRLRPRGSVIGGSDDYKLSGFIDVEARFGAVSSPLVCARFSVGPACCYKNLTGFLIDEDAGIGAAVLVLRFTPMFTHVHNGSGR